MSYSHDLAQINLDNLPMFNPLSNDAFMPQSIVTGSFLQAQDQNNYEETQDQPRDFSIKPAAGNHKSISSRFPLVNVSIRNRQTWFMA